MSKARQRIAMILVSIVLFTSIISYLPSDLLTTWAFHLNFESTGDPAHPNLKGSYGGHPSYFLCLNKGAKAKPDYDYSKRDVDVNYSDGTLAQKRLFWSYIGAWGSYDGKASLSDTFGQPGSKVSANTAKEVAWSKGNSSAGSAWVESMANDGFMSLANIPPGCKSPNDIFKAVSQYTSDTPLWIGKIQSGPGVIDKQKLFDIAGLNDWETFRKYCSVSTDTPGAMAYTDADGLWWNTGNIGDGSGNTQNINIKITYDPSVFRVLEVTGSLEYFECGASGSQQLYRAKGNVKETRPVFYISTTSVPGTGTPGGGDGGGGGNLTGGEISVNIYEHSETFESNYKVELNKYDYETGNPLADSTWQVLEKFDDGQLSTDETDGGIVEEKMWENPTTWTEWLIFEDDLVTNNAGYISHADIRYYDFSHQYCDGHPIPPEPEVGEDASDEEAAEAEDAYAALMDEWQAAVEECRNTADSSQGTFHHWECGGEDIPSVEESFESSGCKAARDKAYETFINLEYSYTFRETDARDGYIIHGQNGHPDDVPIEIITTAASEADRKAKWTSASNEEITVTGYVRNMAPATRAADLSPLSSSEEVLPNTDSNTGSKPGQKWTEPVSARNIPGGPGYETPQKKGPGYLGISYVRTDSNAEEPEVLEISEAHELSAFQKIVNRLLQFFGLPSYYAEEHGAVIRMKAREAEEFSKATDFDAAYDKTGRFGTSNETSTPSKADEIAAENVNFGYMTLDLDWQDTEEATPSNASYSFTRSESMASAANIHILSARAGGEYIDTDSATSDGQPEVDRGPDDNTAHQWVVYDHRVEGQIHFNKRDLALAAGETEAYDSYGDTQGDATLEGAVYGLFAADDIYGPDTQRGGDGTVAAGTGILFHANDLVAVAATDKHGDGSFLTITEKPHSTYNYRTGQIEYSGRTYPKNLYTQDGYIKTYPQETPGRIYKNNQAVNGDCWIGRPLILGNYYIKELTRSEGYELSITGKDMETSNTSEAGRDAYGETEEAKSSPKGTAWITSQLSHAVTFASGNDAYGNRENLLNVEITSRDAEEGCNVVFDGVPENADFYYNGVTVTPVKVQAPDGGSWVDATEAPLYETAQDSTIFKRTQDGSLIEKPGAVPSIPLSYTAYAMEAGKTATSGSVSADYPSRYHAPFTDTTENFQYLKYELEQMMRSLGMRTPNEGNRYSELDYPIYDVHATVNGKVVYGMPEITIEITGATTNKSVIEAILDYYTEKRVFTYGGLQKLENRNGALTATVVVGMTPARDFLYETDDSGAVTAAYLFRLNETYGRYVIRRYTGADMKVTQVTGAAGTKYRIQVTPDFTVDDTGIPADKLIHGSDTDRCLCYSAGDILYDYWYQDGGGNWVGHAPVPRKVYQPNYKVETVLEETVSSSKIPRVNSVEEVADPVGSTFVTYDGISGQYTLHVGTKDASLAGTKKSSFTAALPDGSTAVTQEDINKIGANNVWGYQPGDVLNNSEYVIRIAGAGAGVFTSTDFDKNKTFIRNQRLIYNGNHNLCEDGNTNASPNPLQERIISQQIKVTKDIDKSTYEDANTYSETHEDWFTRLFGGFLDKNTEAEKMDNFRFKVYLKSNLEHLYRDEDGNIIWQNRKGESIAVDNKGTISSFTDPYPALVQKLYTKVPHKTAPLYQNSNDAILSNDSLYSFTDGLIHEEQNPGWTSVLETTDQLVEDGAGTRTIKACNYDKFFDALSTANHDRWDDNAPTYTSWQPIGNEANRTDAAIENAKASDMVRQFAIDWYLKDEIKKLVRDINASENEHAGEAVDYTDQLYDEALQLAIRKAENYLKPFFSYDLDEIYSIEWDSAADGGSDGDRTTLSADTLFGDIANSGEGYYFGTSRYLPYGTYVVAEQQPQYSGLEDFKNRHYQIDRPKEISLPAVYEDYDGSQASPEVKNDYYNYSPAAPQAVMEQKYHIRFNEETPHVIHGRNADGDFQVYKYGLDISSINNGADTAGAGDYFALSQPEFSPYKSYYNPQDNRATGNIPYYLSEGLSGRTSVSKYYRYSSVSEHAGTADAVPYPGSPGDAGTGENPSANHYRDGVATMKGVQTAWEEKFAPMLVPWSVTASANSVTEVTDTQRQPSGESSYKGFGYVKLRNRFYSSKLRIEKLDSETHENILHDNAIFNIYAAERDDTAGGTGQVKFYEKDTTIVGSKEFLKAMGADYMTPLMRNVIAGNAAGVGTLYSGLVSAGTPVCKESEQIILTDKKGNRTGDFKSYTTTRDGLMKDKDTNTILVQADQNTGYLETPQPLGAGVYVLCEVKPPSGYVRTKPVAIEVYSDAITYYKEGNRDRRIAAAIYEYPSDIQTANGKKPEDTTLMARVNVENTPIRLTVEKLKESSADTANTTPDKTVTYQVSGRIDGSLTQIGNNPSYEYAYENGDYLGYAWKKGTLEYLKARKETGEQVEIVYNGRIFAGYGYVTRTLETADDKNPYVTGAAMTLFEAIELIPSGDSEDHAYEGLVIERSGTGNVTRMYLKQGHAGSHVEFLEEVTDAGTFWTAKTVERDDTDILYYDLDSLDIFTEATIDGQKILYGYDRNHVLIPISQLESDKINVNKTDHEHSIFAFKGGIPYLEFAGGEFTDIHYSPKDKSLSVEDGTTVYHIDRDGNRDAYVDPHTGMAYIPESYKEADGIITEKRLVWPIRIAEDEYGNIIARDKITTSRLAAVGENQEAYGEHVVINPTNHSGQNIPEEDRPSFVHSESGYISGTWESEDGEGSHKESTLSQSKTGQNRNDDVLVDDNNGVFEKSMNPVYNEYGLAEYYQRSEETYDKGTDLYDRNDDPVRYKSSDNLEHYNGAAYTVENHDHLNDKEDSLYHRLGEAYVLENTWLSSDRSPNDPFDTAQTEGQADILKRVPAGTYIMEELKSPEGYLKAMPSGILVNEADAIQTVKIIDKTTKTEISKVDSPDTYQIKILNMEQRDHKNNPTVIGTAKEDKARYTYRTLPGATLALYKADKVYTTDVITYPKGWYLKKKSPSEPPCTIESISSTISSPSMFTAQWTTGADPIYLEGIPEGYYILEELSAPSGFIKSQPLEVHITNTANVQLFPMPNDHTKLEVEKYTWESGEKTLLTGAEFTLYEAKTDNLGNVIYENDLPQYNQSQVIDTWLSDDASDFTETLDIPEHTPAGQPTGVTGFIAEFESMYKQYGTAPGTVIRWSAARQATKTSALAGVWYMEDGRRIIEDQGNLLFPDGVDADEKEKIQEAWRIQMAGTTPVQTITWRLDKSAWYVSHTQIDSTVSGQGGQTTCFPTSAVITYETDDNRIVRITVYQEEITRQGRDFTFEYQFDYRRLPGVNARACSYLTTEGVRRFDYLPVGANYVLVETKAPAGYEKVKDRLIHIQSTPDIQRYAIENRPGELLISKSWLNEGQPQKELSGAILALYQASADGTFIQEATYLVDRWLTGADGIYGELDFINGRIPDGFQKGDLKPHRIRKLEEGIYYLAELKSPFYYTRFTPIRLEYKQMLKPQLIRTVNQPVNGQLEIIKQSSTGLPLTGVLMEIMAYRPGEREAVWSATASDRDGVILLDNMPVGESDKTGRIIPYIYRVKEIVPPDGYAVNTEVFTFQFQPDDNGDSYGPTVKAHINLTVRDETTKLYISKKDFDSADSTFIEGALLAVYEVHGRDSNGNWLYDKEKDQKEVWRTTPTEERHLIEGLIAGRTYLLKELEAPPGYQVASPLLFTVSQDGRQIQDMTDKLNIIQIQGDADGGMSITVKGRYAVRVEMSITDEQGVERKRWQADGRGHTLTKSETIREGRPYLLSEHTIYSDGSSVVTSRVLCRLKFRENGTCHVSDRTVSQVNLSLFTDRGTSVLSFTPKAYFTEETRPWSPAPDDTEYLLQESTIYSDGQSCSSSQWSFSIFEQTEITGMTLYDKKTSPLIQKIDATDGRPLPNAGLQLEDIQGNVLEAWITGQSHYEIKTPLSPNKRYHIRETEAPPGYQTMKEDERFTFRITDKNNHEAPLLILIDNQPEPPDEPDIPDFPDIPVIPEIPDKPTTPTPPIPPPVEELIPPFPETPPSKTGLILAVYKPVYQYPSGLIFRRPGWNPGRGYPRPKMGDDTPWTGFILTFTISLLIILITIFCRKRKNDLL